VVFSLGSLSFAGCLELGSGGGDVWVFFGGGGLFCVWARAGALLFLAGLGGGSFGWGCLYVGGLFEVVGCGWVVLWVFGAWLLSSWVV